MMLSGVAIADHGFVNWNTVGIEPLEGAGVSVFPVALDRELRLGQDFRKPRAPAERANVRPPSRPITSAVAEVIAYCGPAV